MKENSSTWDKVMALKPNDDRQKGGANTLTRDDMECILGTVDFFGGDYRQDYFDLHPEARPFAPKFRVFDWLAMRLHGRHSDREAEKTVNKVLAHSFIKTNGVVSEFIKDLQTTDYDIDHSWESIELED